MPSHSKLTKRKLKKLIVANALHIYREHATKWWPVKSVLMRTSTNPNVIDTVAGTHYRDPYSHMDELMHVCFLHDKLDPPSKDSHDRRN